ncbi:MAG: insulinase family protein [Algoriphagus sp.]|jgi:predicted Zn-dependent peptidase|nr:insulinase family protein [Algoriphagus sp.]
MALDRSKAPEFNIPSDFELITPDKLNLNSGVNIYFFKTPGIDAVKLEVIGKSARNQIPKEHVLIPSFTLQMILEGTIDFSEEELSEFFDFHASEAQPVLSYTHEGFSLLSTKRHIEAVLPRFISLFTQATFPSENLEKRKSQRRLSLKLEKEKSSSRSSQLFRTALFGVDHLYGQEVSEEHIDLVSPDLLKEYYTTHLWQNCEIFLTGDLETDQLDYLCQWLEKIPSKQKPDSELNLRVKSTPKIHEGREDALQSSLRIGNWSISKSHPDFHALSVFNTILGGYFGSRLVKNIREDKGHTYGISSSLVELGKYNYWVIGADVQKAYLSEVIQEVYAEIHLLSTELVSEEELDILRNYLVGQMLSKFSSSFDLMDRFKAVHHSGLDLSYYRQKLDFLKKVTPQDLLKIGQTYFSDPPFVEISVG